MKHIIHDWDDDRAARILRNCQHAMADGGKVLIVEAVLPPGNEPSLSKLSDTEMLLFSGGRERTAAEYRELFDVAGLRLIRITSNRSPLNVIEGVKE